MRYYILVADACLSPYFFVARPANLDHPSGNLLSTFVASSRPRKGPLSHVHALLADVAAPRFALLDRNRSSSFEFPTNHRHVMSMHTRVFFTACGQGADQRRSDGQTERITQYTSRAFVRVARRCKDVVWISAIKPAEAAQYGLPSARVAESCAAADGRAARNPILLGRPLEIPVAEEPVFPGPRRSPAHLVRRGRDRSNVGSETC